MTDPREIEALCAEAEGLDESGTLHPVYPVRVLAPRMAAALRALAAQLAAARADMAQCVKYEVWVSGDQRSAIFVERVGQRDGSFLWRVCDGYGAVLDKTGEWMFEPMPSSRSDEYLASTRWPTREEAATAARAAIDAAKGGA